MKLSVLGVALLSTAGLGAARAGVIHVPGDYPSILAAVDAAVSGDSVLVGAGTWTDAATRMVIVNGQSVAVKGAAFLRPGIVVIGVDGAESTFVIGDLALEAFVHAMPGTAPMLVDGFTITGHKSLLAAQTAPLEMRSCRLVNNGYSAALINNAAVVLRDCLIEGNEWAETSDLAGAVDVTNSSVELYDCVIQNNNKRAMRVVGSARVVMDSCWVSGHAVVATGGGCRFEQVSNLEVRNCWFVHNSASGSSGGGVSCEAGTVGKIEFCVFAFDSANGGGGVATEGSVRLSNNTFYACDGAIGAAIQVSGDDLRSVDRNIIAFCTALYGAVRRTQGANHSQTGCNIFWANQGGDFSTLGTWTPAATDIFADPQFCDHPNGDYTLHANSPGAPGVTPACGAIGALGVSCGSVSVRPMGWGRIKSAFR
jgi:hypothetical protein